MSTWKFTIEVEINDEELAAHDGSEKPPPNDPRDWYGGDLTTALEEAYAEIVHDQLEAERIPER